MEGVVDDDRDFERHQAAHHEAGHSAVAWALNGSLYEGTIRPDGPFGGSALYTLHGDQGASVERIISVLAGPTAQRRFARSGDDGGERDRERVATHLDALCRHPAAAAIVRRHCQAEADRLVSENWDAVEAIAAALLAREYLTGDDLNVILDDVANARSNRRWAEVVARSSAPPVTFTRIR